MNAYGGIILGHDAKFSFELTKSDAKRGSKVENRQAVNDDADGKDDNSRRAIWVQRHPAIAGYSRFGYTSIDERGFQ